MRAKELPASLRGLSIAELEKRENELRESLARITMKRHARRLDRTSDLELTKRDLARVLTILGERRRAAGKGEGHGRA
jgi:large subunit ribosomal protein L29